MHAHRFYKPLCFSTLIALFVCCSSPFTVVEELSEEASIFPDYQGELIIPNNIAPLNFEIQESGSCFVVQIVNNEIVLLEKREKKSKIMFSEKKWKDILQGHIGDTLEIRVFSGDSYEKMIAYKPFRWIVSEDSIDPYVVYRLISIEGVADASQQPMGVFERNTGTFDERLLIDNLLSDGACMNCHHFSANRGSHFCMHFRKAHAGTLIAGDSLVMVNMGLPNGERGVFGNYSPDGRFFIFSTNQLLCIQEMLEKRFISWPYDIACNLFLYDAQTNSVLSSSELTTSGTQKTYPCWSHDGQYFYFCQSNWQTPLVADSLGAKRSILLERIQKTHYSLVRMAFDGKNELLNKGDTCPPSTFGPIETIVSSEDLGGRSISLPACSPDGKFISFSTTDFGTLHPTSKSGRMWLYNLETKALRQFEPDVENPITSSSEWSSNSRWLVLSSRRMDGSFSRPFFVHVDSLGNTGKPFAMPQKEPDFYRKQDFSYGLPVLISTSVPMSAYDISDAIRRPVKRPNYLFEFKKTELDASIGIPTSI